MGFFGVFFQKNFSPIYMRQFSDFYRQKGIKYIIDFEEKILKFFFVDFNSILQVFYVQVQNFRGFSGFRGLNVGFRVLLGDQFLGSGSGWGFKSRGRHPRVSGFRVLDSITNGRSDHQQDMKNRVSKVHFFKTCLKRNEIR